MSTRYQIIANCNYESADGDTRAIHEIRRAVDLGLTYDEALYDALDELERVLEKWADSEAAHEIDKCYEAERAVLAAWTEEVQEEVRAARLALRRD